MKESRIAKCIRICALLTTLFLACALDAQDGSLPTVTCVGVPFYPPVARTANVEGIVHIKVTTDGGSVIAALTEDGHKVLAEAARENVRTWKFLHHEPTTFTVTYRFRLVTDLPERNHPRIVLQLPREVEVDILRWPATIDLSPELKPGKPQADTTSPHEAGHAAPVEKTLSNY
jgi:hypothetical protein